MSKLNTWFLTDFNEIENVDYYLPHLLRGEYIDDAFTSTGKDQIDYGVQGNRIELPSDLGDGAGFKNGSGDDCEDEQSQSLTIQHFLDMEEIYGTSLFNR